MKVWVRRCDGNSILTTHYSLEMILIVLCSAYNLCLAMKGVACETINLIYQHIYDYHLTSQTC